MHGKFKKNCKVLVRNKSCICKDAEGISYHVLGTYCDTRIMLKSSNAYVITSVERQTSSGWITVLSYTPDYCPLCGRKNIAP